MEKAAAKKSANLADNAEGSLFVTLTEWVVLEYLGEVFVGNVLGGFAENVDSDIVCVNHDDHIAAHCLSEFLCRFMGLVRSHFSVSVVGRDGAVAGTVDGSRGRSENIVEYAAFAEQLAYAGNDGGKYYFGSADRADGKLHCLRHAKTDVRDGRA